MSRFQRLTTNIRRTRISTNGNREQNLEKLINSKSNSQSPPHQPSPTYCSSYTFYFVRAQHHIHTAGCTGHNPSISAPFLCAHKYHWKTHHPEICIFSEKRTKKTCRRQKATQTNWQNVLFLTIFKQKSWAYLSLAFRVSCLCDACACVIAFDFNANEGENLVL